MSANEAPHPHRAGVSLAGIGLRDTGLAISALAGALLANVLICYLFIFAAETGLSKRPPIDGVVCRSPQAVHHFSRLGS